MTKMLDTKNQDEIKKCFVVSSATLKATLNKNSKHTERKKKHVTETKPIA